MLRTCGSKITWLGHSTFRVTTPSGKVILVDPWLTGNPACPESLKKLARLDVMLITHGHGDHLATPWPSLARTSRRSSPSTRPACGLSPRASRKRCRCRRVARKKAGEIEVTMVHAIHSSSIEDDGKIVYGGEPCGYIVRLPGGLTVYHAGDTTVFGDMKLIGELYAPELACLPIGDLYTMGPREAALAIRLLGVRHVVPMHYGTFPALTGTPEALRELTQDIAGLEIHALKPGESLS